MSRTESIRISRQRRRMGATKQQRKQAKKDGQAAKPTLGQALKPIIDALKQSLEDRD